MVEEQKENISLMHPEKNAWYQLMQFTTAFDIGKAPHGWHWLVALHYLLKFDIRSVQDDLPEGHPLKLIPPPSEGTEHAFKPIIQKLLDDLDNPENIEEIDFSKINFPNYVDFSNFIFPISVSFRYSNFHKSAKFTWTKFYNFTHFSNTIFYQSNGIGVAHFNRSPFSYTTFENAQFVEQANFGGALLREAFGFRRAKFFQGAYFNGVPFYSGADFEDAEFYSGAMFDGAIFYNEASFKKTAFYAGAIFSNAKFAEYPYSANFYKAKFSSPALFDGTEFSGYAVFQRANFTASINFKNAKFPVRAPTFYNAEIHSDIIWKDVEWPKFVAPTDPKKYDGYIESILQNQNTYENLANQMKKLEKYHDEHLFFRHEMYCRRKLERPLMKPFYWAYELFADYGYGLGHAAIAWLVHIVLGTIIIALIASCYGWGFSENLSCSISVSFANANPYTLLGFDSSKLTSCYEMLDKLLPVASAIIRIVQTTLGIALIFLLALTLRIRFRLK